MPSAADSPAPRPPPGLDAYLASARARVDAVLERWGDRADAFWGGRVPAAARYSLLGSGKRLRPTLVFAAYDALGGGGGVGGGGQRGAGVRRPAGADPPAGPELEQAFSASLGHLPAKHSD